MVVVVPSRAFRFVGFKFENINFSFVSLSLDFYENRFWWVFLKGRENEKERKKDAVGDLFASVVDSSSLF